MPLDDAAAAIRLIAERVRVIAEGAGALARRSRAGGQGGHRQGRLHRLGREHRPARVRPDPRRRDALTWRRRRFDVEAARARFSSLRSGFAFLDAPGGTQVPDEVGEAIAAALRDASGNLGAPYATGRAVEAILEGAKADAARFLGCTPAEIAFGMNMTTLNFALTRAAGRDFAAGDEILTTELDHDGGVAPWVELAADRGLTVRIAAATDELTVDYDDLERKLSDRTRVVAFALASNATGSVADATADLPARPRGRRALLDRRRPLCGPRADRRGRARLRRPALLALQVLRPAPRDRLPPRRGCRGWRPYKARPSSSEPLGRRFETGTLPYELLAGFRATIAYLDSLGGLAVLRDYERTLGEQLVGNLPDGVVLYGPDMDGRVPTFLLNVEGVDAGTAAHALAERGIGVWYADNWYCVALADRLPPQSLRVGLIHYNTAGRGRPPPRGLAAL